MADAMNVPRLVYVVWQDCGHIGGWQNMTAAAEETPATVHTAGFLVHESDELMVVAGGVNNCAQYGATTVILKATVVSVATLREAVRDS